MTLQEHIVELFTRKRRANQTAQTADIRPAPKPALPEQTIGIRHGISQKQLQEAQARQREKEKRILAEERQKALARARMAFKGRL